MKTDLSSLMVLQLGFSLFTGGSAIAADNSEAPACDDARVQRGGRVAIENGYASVGAPTSMAAPFVKFLPKLYEFTGSEADDIRKTVSKSLSIKSAGGLRLCRAEVSRNSFLVILVAKNPNPPNDLGFLAVNIGLPGASGVEGWVSKFN